MIRKPRPPGSTASSPVPPPARTSPRWKRCWPTARPRWRRRSTASSVSLAERATDSRCVPRLAKETTREEPKMKTVTACVTWPRWALFCWPLPVLAVEPYLPKSPRTFAFLDGNDDGKIALGEIAPRAEKRLLRYDSDGNGAVSTAELDAVMQKSLERRRTRIMATLGCRQGWRHYRGRTRQIRRRHVQ